MSRVRVESTRSTLAAASIVVCLFAFCTLTIAQPAIQYLDVTQPDGKSYSETRDFSDLATCHALMRKNLAAAKKLGYRTSGIGSKTVQSISYSDPKTGMTIKQSCSMDKAFDPLPVHPASSFPSGFFTAAGVAPPPAQVTCPVPTRRTAILFIFGQSNAGNHGEGRYTAGPKVAVFHAGKCYQASDPLPGATGEDATPWGRLGDLLVNRGTNDKVVVIAVAAGGTFIADWKPGGSAHHRLKNGLITAVKAGYTPTALLWHQGELDAAGGTKQDAYIAAFTSIHDSIRTYGVRAPIYVAVATICAVRDATTSPDQIMLNLGPSELVRQAYDAYVMRGAQMRLAGSFGNMVRQGANTDTIGPEYRYDGCHIGRRGLDMHARLWLDALAGGGEKKPVGMQSPPK